jgi:AcrR family transcriptional regulator
MPARTLPRNSDCDVQEARREELLAGLRDFVLDNGFARVRVDDIASWLHCSKATLYRIAAGRVPLAATVLGAFLSEVAALAERRSAPIADPAERITAYLAATAAQTRMSAACYADMTSHDLTGDLYGRHANAMAGRLREQIDEGMRAGAFRQAHAGFLAESAAMITDANCRGGLPGRAGLTAAEAQSLLTDLMVATLTNTAYQR